jgi:hypothetical protein
MEMLRIFSLQVQEHLTRSTLEKLPYVFPDRSIPSWKVILTRVYFLAGIKCKFVDCCVNSCMAFTGPRASLARCLHCKKREPRYNAAGKPRKRWCYIPLIPRLKTFLSSSAMADQMLHRDRHVHEPDRMKDVYDSAHFRSLLRQLVVSRGKRYKHRYFSDRRDVALGLSSDGFAPFKRRTKTAWPLLIFNYNLPPELRFLIQFILCVGVIPGPNKPKDMDSFLYMIWEELVELEVGIAAFDSISQEVFILRAHLILVFGDIPAVSMLTHMKGHNGYAPCRFCNIKGVRNPGRAQCPYYVPLNRSTHPDVRADQTRVKKYDPRALPLRTEEEFIRQAEEIKAAPTAKERKALAVEYGVKNVPLLFSLSALSFPHSFPYEFMHLI